METLFCVPALNAEVALHHLRRWFNADFRPWTNEPIYMFLGQMSLTPLGLQKGLKEHPNHFFCADSYFALATSLSNWSAVQAFLHTHDPEWLEQLTSCLSPPPATFEVPGLPVEPKHPQVMGILNLTPDSFFDGGQYNHLETALTQVEKMIQEGADWIDIGAESTRPGAEPISANQELERLLPILLAIKQRWSTPISVDTSKPEVAEVVLKAGAKMINDVSGLRGGEKMLHWVHKYQAGYILMHTQGTPRTMQDSPQYQNPVIEVFEFFKKKLSLCQTHGIRPSRILLDPGIGFGKLLEHNLELLRMNHAWANLGCHSLIGTSNKSFMAKALSLPLKERQAASLATQCLGHSLGAFFFRVHHVKDTRQALDMAQLYRSFSPS